MPKFALESFQTKNNEYKFKKEENEIQVYSTGDEGGE
jgi:hypothetical protein